MMILVLMFLFLVEWFMVFRRFFFCGNFEEEGLFSFKFYVFILILINLGSFNVLGVRK